MATRLYEIARRLGVSSKELMSALREKGLEVRNHLAAMNEDDESLAVSLFSQESPAKREKHPQKKKARKSQQPASAEALGPAWERLNGIEAQIEELEALSKKIATILLRRKDFLIRIRRATGKLPKPAAAVSPETDEAVAPDTVGVATPEEEVVPVVGEALPEDVRDREAAEDAATRIAAGPPDVAEDKSVVAEAEMAESQEAPPVEEAPREVTKKPAKPRRTRKVVSIQDRLGGPKPVITKAVTPISRPPARGADGRRRAPGREQPTEVLPGEPAPAGMPSGKPGGARGRGPRGKVRFFPKHGEDTWTEGPSPHLRHMKAKMADHRVEVKRPEKLEVALPITVKEFSLLSGIRQAEIIKFFLMRKTFLNANSHLDEDALETLGIGYTIEVTVKKEQDLEAPLREIEERVDPEEVLVPRPPVVTMLGHVDHGKTSLLDRIRKTNVQEREFGGITQHISACTIDLPNFKVTFIDTPGHAAFTQMRARGANATDIAVLVVAADDGPMPQTEEAISHIRAADVPIVVAINKIDLATANVDRTKQRLAELEVLPPEWGGNTEMVSVSAETGEGIEDLLETLHLVGEVQGLKANPDRDALGVVLESRSSRGRGILVTCLIQNGTLRVGDCVVCGQAYGRIRGLWSTTTEKAITEAGPSTPVEIMGLSGVPEAGERLYVLRDEQLASSIAAQRLAHHREAERAQREEKVTLENLFDRMKEDDDKELRVVVKADVQGSVEALQTQIVDLGTEEVKVKILHAGVGMVSETDVVLAEASKGIVLGFNVAVADRARAVAEERGVQIRSYTVIYELLDEVRAALEDRLSPIYEEVVRGHAEIRQIFKASRIGTIAGCMVTDGTVGRNDQIRVLREKDVVHSGTMASLRREKEDAKDVREGFECGIKVADFEGIKEGDIIECFRTVAKRRTL